jgi:hypothetical protein
MIHTLVMYHRLPSATSHRHPSDLVSWGLGGHAVVAFCRDYLSAILSAVALAKVEASAKADDTASPSSKLSDFDIRFSFFLRHFCRSTLTAASGPCASSCLIETGAI